MRIRLVLFVWTFALSTWSVFLFFGGTGAGAQADPRVVTNGDVDASGGVNISDAVWILRFLFSNGPEPVPIVCQPVPEDFVHRGVVESRPFPTPESIESIPGVSRALVKWSLPILSAPTDQWLLITSIQFVNPLECLTSGTCIGLVGGNAPALWTEVWIEDAEGNRTRITVASEIPATEAVPLAIPPGGRILVVWQMEVSSQQLERDQYPGSPGYQWASYGVAFNFDGYHTAAH